MSVFQISEKTAEKGVPREGGTQRRVRAVFLNLFLYAEPFASKKFSAEPLNQSDFIGGTPKTKVLT